MRSIILNLRQSYSFAETGLAGMSQGDLIQWYVNKQNEKNNYSSTTEVETEIKRIRAIIEVKL